MPQKIARQVDRWERLGWKVRSLNISKNSVDPHLGVRLFFLADIYCNKEIRYCLLEIRHFKYFRSFGWITFESFC